MYYSDRIKVDVAGTPKPFTTTRVMANWVEIVADKDNTGLVYIGGSNTTHGTLNGTNKDYIGIPLYKGIWLLFREMGGPPCYDLSTIYVDADNNNDAIDFVYGRA
jgi:hypothetical protein